MINKHLRVMMILAGVFASGQLTAAVQMLQVINNQKDYDIIVQATLKDGSQTSVTINKGSNTPVSIVELNKIGEVNKLKNVSLVTPGVTGYSYKNMSKLVTDNFSTAHAGENLIIQVNSVGGRLRGVWHVVTKSENSTETMTPLHVENASDWIVQLRYETKNTHSSHSFTANFDMAKDADPKKPSHRNFFMPSSIQTDLSKMTLEGKGTTRNSTVHAITKEVKQQIAGISQGKMPLIKIMHVGGSAIIGKGWQTAVTLADESAYLKLEDSTPMPETPVRLPHGGMIKNQLKTK